MNAELEIIEMSKDQKIISRTVKKVKEETAMKIMSKKAKEVGSNLHYITSTFDWDQKLMSKEYEIIEPKNNVIYRYAIMY